MPQLSGTVSERYRVLERIGAGAFGEVYSAEDLTLSRTVALKRLRLEAVPDGPQQDEARRRFLQEAQVAARLRHPNIVTIHDVVSSPEHSFMVLELVEGHTLEELLDSHGRLDVHRAIELVAPAAEALDYAHREGIVHRDIKPGNIMIDRGGQVKVTDFGIAKIDSGATLTNTGYLLGTPKYMSPEQARGETLDGRSDLFSLGCVLYQCLTGRLAFDGDSVTAVLLSIVSDQPPPIEDLDVALPPPLVRVLERSLEKDREKRYSTGGELAMALRGALAGETLDAAASGEDRTRVVPPPSVVTAARALDSAGELDSARAAGPSSSRSRDGAPVSPRFVAGLGLGALALVAVTWLVARGPGGEPPSAESADAADVVVADATETGDPTHEGAPAESDSAPRTRPEQPRTQPSDAEERPSSQNTERERQPPASPAKSDAAAGPETVDTSAPVDADPPSAAPQVHYVDTFYCRRGAEFHVDPEEALVQINGRVIGQADDWDDAGGGDTWYFDGPGVYSVRLTHEKYETAWVKIVVDPSSSREIADVDTELRRLNKRKLTSRLKFWKKKKNDGGGR